MNSISMLNLIGNIKMDQMKNEMKEKQTPTITTISSIYFFFYENQVKQNISSFIKDVYLNTVCIDKTQRLNVFWSPGAYS